MWYLLRLNVLSERQGKERKAAQELLLFMGIRTSCGCTAFNRLNNYMAFLFMIADVFNNVLEKVSNATEVNVDSILHSNREECVDARYVAIAILSEKLSDKQISEVSGWSVQLVSKAKNAFKDRCKFRWGLKELYKELCIFVAM